MISDISDEKEPTITQRLREDWSKADTGVKVSIGVILFALFVLFLLWAGLFFVSPTVWLILTSVTAAVVLFIAVILAIGYLMDEL